MPLVTPMREVSGESWALIVDCSGLRSPWRREWRLPLRNTVVKGKRSGELRNGRIQISGFRIAAVWAVMQAEINPRKNRHGWHRI